MQIKLYKYPKLESGKQTNDVRLLFEGVDFNRSLITDFYLYVWITDYRISGFQAVLNNDIVLNYKNEIISVGLITRDPINRAVSNKVSENREKEIRDIIMKLESKDFPLLIKTVKKLVSNVKDNSLKLCDSEITFFNKYCRFI